MLGLRQKLALGLGGLLLIVAIIGIQSVRQIAELGQDINAILSENYKSIAACEKIKEAVEQVNNGVLLMLLGYGQAGDDQIRVNTWRIAQAIDIEMHNLTLPGEAEKAALTRSLFQQYESTLQTAINSDTPLNQRQEIYFRQLLPLSQELKATADSILLMNQESMSQANLQAIKRSAEARREMYILLLAGAFIAAGFVWLTRQWVLLPIRRLIESANEIRRGNLELVVQSNSQDEIGQLSTAFNAMAASLREFSRSGQAKLARVQQLTQQTFKSLPDAVALISPDGTVEVSTRAAQDAFGLKPRIQVQTLPFIWVSDLLEDVLKTGHTAGTGSSQVIQHFIRGEEYYFRPRAVPILNEDSELTGMILIIEDITQLRQYEEMKRGMISTVSHQLKTPLTSIRMAVHLLLDEKTGPLNTKQADLLVTACDDSERLNGIIEDLLDISRIQSGKVKMECRAVSPHELVSTAVEEFRTTAIDRGIDMNTSLPDDLPDVWADAARIGHVFANLLSNAIKYTAPGGQVTLSARADDSQVYFSVSDTGQGIPAYYLQRLFEQFSRVPGQDTETGVGLGLAIAKEIVDAHGGTIQVESKEGEGSTFTFSLKIANLGEMEL